MCESVGIIASASDLLEGVDAALPNLDGAAGRKLADGTIGILTPVLKNAAARIAAHDKSDCRTCGMCDNIPEMRDVLNSIERAVKSGERA
jgi:hypothetical protein